MLAPQNEAFDRSALLKFTSQSSVRSNTARYRSAWTNEVVTMVASLNCASFSSAPVKSFHLMPVQSGGSAPRSHRSHQLMTSYHRNPLPSKPWGLASIVIRLWLNEAEGICACWSQILLKGTPEKFGAYILSFGIQMFASCGVPEKS